MDNPKTKHKDEAKAAQRLIPRLEAQRRKVDQRYDPRRSIDGAGRYLEIAQSHFGDDPQLAVAAYHMGIGNLDSVIADYTGEPVQSDPLHRVDEHGLSYAQIFFDTSPTRHVKAWKLLSSFGDDSSTYLWRVLAAKQAMHLYRSNRPKLESLNRLETARASLEEVYHPKGSTEIFADGAAIDSAIDRGDLVALPNDPAHLGFEVDKQMGELAPKLGNSKATYRALRPEALAALTYIGAKVKQISGEKRPLRVTSSVRDTEYQKLLIGINSEATTEYSLHTTGYSFDILRKYASNQQAEAFQFVLDRMRAEGLIDYAYEPAAIHVTVSDNAKELLG